MFKRLLMIQYNPGEIVGAGKYPLPFLNKHMEDRFISMCLELGAGSQS